MQKLRRGINTFSKHCSCYNCYNIKFGTANISNLYNIKKGKANFFLVTVTSVSLLLQSIQIETIVNLKSIKKNMAYICDSASCCSIIVLFRLMFYYIFVLSALFWFKLLNAMKSSGYQALPVLRVLYCDQAMPSWPFLLGQWEHGREKQNIECDWSESNRERQDRPEYFLSTSWSNLLVRPGQGIKWLLSGGQPIWSQQT